MGDVFLSKALRQRAAYWGLASTSKWGKPVSQDTPVEISCRWESSEGEQVNQEGEVLRHAATALVDRDLVLNGYLKLLGTGQHVDSSFNPDRTAYADALKILHVAKVPRFKGGKYVRTVQLGAQG